jgi:hypothetical protein
MSKGIPPISLVIEWSPKSITVFDGGTGSTKTHPSLPDLVGYAGREAIIAVSRRSVFVRPTRVPNSSPEEIRLVVQMRLGDLFPVAATDLAFDIILTQDVNVDGRLAVVVAMPSAELKRLLDDAKTAGLKVRKVVPASIGSAMLAHNLGREEAAVVEHLEEGLTVDLVAHGILRTSRVVAANANPSAEVARTYAIAGLPCGTVIAAGGLGWSEADMKTSNTSLSAIAGAWSDKLQVNLELPERVAARKRAAQTRQLQLSLAMCAVSVIAAGVVYSGRAADAKKVDDLKASLAKQSTSLKTKQKEAENDALAATAKEKTLQRAFAPAQNMSDIVTLIANRTVNGVWLTGITAERGKPVYVRGTAMTPDEVYGYLGNLQKEPRLRNVTLVFASTAQIDEKQIVNFSLSAFPIGNVPLVDDAQRKSS